MFFIEIIEQIIPILVVIYGFGLEDLKAARVSFEP